MKKKVLLTAAICFFVHIAHATTCSPSQAEKADQAIDNLNTWDDIDSFSKKFRQCDDGSISEGVSEAIAQLILKDWEGSIKAISQKSLYFQRFTIIHINETLNENDLEKIQKMSEKECKKTDEALCKKLGKAAQTALKPSKQ